MINQNYFNFDFSSLSHDYGNKSGTKKIKMNYSQTAIKQSPSGDSQLTT